MRVTIRHLTVNALAAAAIVGGTVALAHHSFAMFDMSKRQSVTGTVHALEWINPHVLLWLNVTDENGVVTLHSFAGATPSEMSRVNGWNKHVVSVGEKVMVEFAPLRDGKPGGMLGKITRADGSVVGNARGTGGSSVAPPASGYAPAPGSGKPTR